MKRRVTPRPYKLVDGERRPIKGKSTWTYEFAVTRAGKRKFITKGGFRTKADAEQALADELANYGREPGRERVKPSVMPLRDFVEKEWLPALVSLKPATVNSYTDLANAYLLPHLGDDRMCDITPGRIAALYGTLRKSGRRRKPGGLSENTVHHVHVLVGKVFKYAVETGALAASPVDRLPRDGTPVAQAPDPAKLKHWTRDEALAFLVSCSADRLAALWRFAIDAGMRRGELAAIRWADVDLETGIATVRRNRVVIGWAVEEGTPKTKHGQRSIDLDPATVTVLKTHRKQQTEDRLRWGAAWANHDGLVFVHEDGSPLHPQSIDWHLEQAVKAVNASLAREHEERVERGEKSDLSRVPWIGVHGLRHTCATLGLAAGVPLKVMSERLGHSSTTVTADLYQHVVPGMQADAAKAIMGGLA